jgi:glycosyltransferase involved in cell wall biosynthesis
VALVQRAASAGLGDRVLFPGYRADVPALVAAFDAYVLPSLWEGLPLALLEALALGKPIVASRVGGVPEIVEHGVLGFLVPPRDPGALAEHLVRVVDDGALRARASELGPLKFARQFSVEAMVDAHARFFEEVAARRLGRAVVRPEAHRDTAAPRASERAPRAGVDI